MGRRARLALIAAAAVTLGGGLALTARAEAAVVTSCPNHTVKTVSGSPSYTDERGCILSFDGTPIVYNLYEPLNPKPHSLYTILEGPGFADAGGAANEQLLAAGFADMTWDPRGFGQSGGYVEIDAPAEEGRDTAELISKVLTGRPEIAVDTGGKDGQPRYYNDSASSNTIGQPVVGMSGTSYGGGIQLALASQDNRVKAIVPGFTWNDLGYALFPNDVTKLEWDDLLFGAGTEAGPNQHVQGDFGAIGEIGGTGGLQVTGGIDPAISAAVAPSLTLGYPNAATTELTQQRSLSSYGAGGHTPHVPTLLVQGLADTLFNANQAVANATQISTADPGLPVKMILQCLGHTDCQGGGDATGMTAPSTSPVWPGQSSLSAYDNEIVAWFDYYLRGIGSNDGMPDNVVIQDQTGSFYGLPSVPTPTSPGPASYVSAPLAARLVIDPAPTGGLPLDAGTGGNFPSAALSDAATNASDPGQATVPVLTAPSDAPVRVAGLGHVTADITQTGQAVNLYFRLIDKQTGDVVDLQTQPIRVTAGTTQISLDLVGVGYTLPAGHTLELQVSTSTTLYYPNAVTGLVTLTNGSVEVPVVPNSVATPPATTPGCPRATGELSGRTLGLLHLGMTRAQANAADKQSTTRGTQYEQFFCLTPTGIRVGYASPKLLKALPRKQRAAYTGRVVWISTANSAYSLNGIRPGTPVAQSIRGLNLSHPFHIGPNTWYLTPIGSATGELKVRGGKVQEIGIADRALAGTSRLQRIFLTSFS